MHTFSSLSLSIPLWSSGTYSSGSKVSHEGSIYESTTTTTTEPTPSATDWTILARRDFRTTTDDLLGFFALNSTSSELPTDSVIAYDDTGALTTTRDSSSFYFRPLGILRSAIPANSWGWVSKIGKFTLSVPDGETWVNGDTIYLDYSASWTNVSSDFEVGHVISASSSFCLLRF